jgi:flagellar basal body P-ring protein FlgI
LSSDIYYLAETDEIVVNNVEDDVVFISDAMGRVVFSSTVCGETMTISAKDLTEGIYFVRMNGDAVKFVK